MSPLPPPIVITSPAQLAAFLEEASAHPAVAVDTESNSLHAYHEQVCLIQLSTRQADYVVDPLAGFDLSPLGELFADPSVQKVFHAAEQDVGWLKRDFGFRFANLFDTMWAARILGWPRVGLADILEETFGVRTDKRYQRYNWGERPLSPEALAYARLDTHYLLPLRDLQMEALERMGRMEEARELFAQLTETPAAGQPFGPGAFWRMKGVRELAPEELAVLWELYLWRDRVASERNLPPFRVMGDRTLLALARARPRSLEEMGRVPGMNPHLVERYGRAVLKAVARGRKSAPPRPPAREPRREEAVVERYQALRAWRRREADHRGVDVDVILPNAVLWALAERNPATPEELAEVEELTPWKRRTYGEAILNTLAASSRQRATSTQ